MSAVVAARLGGGDNVFLAGTQTHLGQSRKSFNLCYNCGMKKIIVKCRLHGKDDFRQKLSEIGLEFGEIYYLHDRIYIPREYQRGANYPRLDMRTLMTAVDKKPKYLMILKRHIEDSGVDIIDQTEVKDYSEAVNIIHQLGFKKVSEVSRQRQELKMSELTIYLDKVENLPGYYAKMEAPLLEGESSQAVREDFEKTFAIFGQKDFTRQTFTELMNEFRQKHA